MNKEITIDAKSNVFTYKALRQKDSKNNLFINPIFNPGALKRIKSVNNKTRKYEIRKELYYEEGNKKVWLSVGDQITFVK